MLIEKHWRAVTPRAVCDFFWDEVNKYNHKEVGRQAGTYIKPGPLLLLPRRLTCALAACGVVAIRTCPR